LAVSLRYKIAGALPFIYLMAEIVRDAQQDFWRSPTILEGPAESPLSLAASQSMSDACDGCGSEFMIGAMFCHTCGLRRPLLAEVHTPAEGMHGMLAGKIAWARPWIDAAAGYWRELSFPNWLHYLHFHEIKHWVGLPTAALIAFMIGLGCIAGAIGVSLFYKASNLAEFQAIQMWRIEWLLAATASFVAGILLKKPTDIDGD
jgi:hypothetical protein